MLFGKKKYGYLDMVALYFRLAPAEAAIKIANGLIGSFIPTLNILITARFLDAAVAAAVGGRGELGGVYPPLAAIVAVLLFNYYAGIAVGLANTRAGNRIRAAAAPAVAEKKAAVKFRYYERQESVDIMSRAAGGFEGNLQGFFDLALGAWSIAAQAAGFVVVLGAQLWWASVVFVLTCIPSFVISYRFGNKKYGIDREMTKTDRKAGYIFGMLTSRDTVEERYVYGYTDKMNEEYRGKYELARVARKNAAKRGYTSRAAAGMLVTISGAAAIAILLPSAAYPAGAPRITIGMFTALVNAIFGLSQQMQTGIPANITDFKYKSEYLKDLNKFLEFEENEGAACPPGAGAGVGAGAGAPELKSIEFKNVSFKYPGTERHILKDFNLSLSAGKHYAVVGANGAGKTTLIKILTKLYDEYEGEILINGRELRGCPHAEIKAMSAVVYQDFCRYPLDFYGNIAIGNANDMNNHERVEGAVNLIGLAETVGALPEKYATPITKARAGGVDLSGGEWQKIALARLIVSPAPLKILDEPTAALDPVSESRVYEQFGEIVDKNQKNRRQGITIFISHRLGSTKLADEIIVISGNRVAERGTFEELMAAGGIYAEMFASQSEWYRENK